jgi:predicted transcriptional regulator
MRTLTLRLDDALYAKVTSLAKRRKTTQSEVVREAIQASVEHQNEMKSHSALDLARDLEGTVQGPKDLSVNKEYFKGFGR